MSNAFQSITSGLAQLKNYYQGPIISQFNDETNIYRGAAKGKHPWSGLQVVRPWKVRRNQGVGAVSDGGTLPAIGRQGTVQAIIPAKFNYLRFGITGPMIKSSQNDVGSFVRSAAYELAEGYKDLQSDVNRQLAWDGTGDLATMSVAANGSNSITIAGRESGEAALKFIDIGLVVDIYTSAGVLKQSAVEVTAITTGTATSTTAVLTVNPAVTAAATDVLVRANSFGNEIQGLLTQLDGATSTVFNVDRSQFISAQGNAISNSGNALNLDFMQNGWNEALRRGAGKISAIYTDYDSQRMYQKLLVPDKRFVNTMQGDGGFASKDKNYLEFNGTPIVADKDCPKRMFFLPEDMIVKYVLSEMEFSDETGSMYIAQTSADSFETRIRFFANLFNEKPSASVALSSYIAP